MDVRRPSSDRFLRRLQGSALVLGLLSCSSHDEGDEFLAMSCGEVELVACDILDEACQKRTFRLTQCATGYELEDVPEVLQISEDELRELLEADPPSEEEAKQRKALDGLITSIFKLIRFVPPEVDSVSDSNNDTLVEGILAFYSSSNKAIVIVDHGEDGDGSLEPVLTLAHEFTHALQDSEFDLARYNDRFAQSTEGSLTSKFMPEGDARFAELLVQYTDPRRGIPKDQWQAHADESVEAVFTLAGDPTEPFTNAQLYLPYLAGYRYVGGLWWEDGRDAVLDAFKSPAKDSRGYLSWDASAMGGVSATATSAESPLAGALQDPTSWVTDELGSFALYGLLRREWMQHPQLLQAAFEEHEDPPSWLRQVASSWQADRFHIAAQSDGADFVASWEIRLAPGGTDLIPPAVLDGLSANVPNVKGRRLAKVSDGGDVLTILMAEDEAVDLQEIWSKMQESSPRWAGEPAWKPVPESFWHPHGVHLRFTGAGRK